MSNIGIFTYKQGRGKSLDECKNHSNPDNVTRLKTFKIGLFFYFVQVDTLKVMKTPILTLALAMLSLTAFGAAAGGGNPPVVPPTVSKPGCNKSGERKKPEPKKPAPKKSASKRSR